MSAVADGAADDAGGVDPALLGTFLPIVVEAASSGRRLRSGELTACGEQDADMVILLHREDAYEKESQRAGEADLIVAKHRNGPTDTIVVAFQGHCSRFINMATNC